MEGQAVKLRGRFTLALALAALVPISVAAVVTSQVIAASYRSDSEQRRTTAEATIQLEVKRLDGTVIETTTITK